MPKQKQVKNYATFNKGLITEATELTFPENATQDELNVNLSRKGNRQRRKGLDYERSYVKSNLSLTSDTIETEAITYGTWKAVAGNGRINFIVIQISSTLYFYDAAASPLSSGLKASTVDISPFLAPGAQFLGRAPCSYASGKGYLFVTNEKANPFYVTYDAEADTFSATAVDIKIRDFDGIEESGVDVQDRPTTLTTDHKYNIFNQGWYIEDVYPVNNPQGGSANTRTPWSHFFTSEEEYASNADVWWVMKDGQGEFNPLWKDTVNRGNTPAPNGHYLLDPFYKDRSAVSGIPGIDVVSTISRPTAVGFYASRVWYAGQKGQDINGHIYYSQIVEDSTKIGKCYQENDPTAETLNSLLATDGGLIVIAEVGNVIALSSIDTSLVVFATNGIWEITGPDGAFKATDFFIRKVSDIGVMGAESIVNADGRPYWWSENSIYTIEANEVSGKLGVVSLTDNTIKTFYQGIPTLSKLFCRGEFDPVQRKIVWMYGSDAPSDDKDRYRYNRILNYHIDLQAFYPWTVEDLASGTPRLAGAVFSTPVSEIERVFDVYAGDDAVINVQGGQVLAKLDSFISTDKYIRYLTIAPQVADPTKFEITFSEFDNPNLRDWQKEDNVGIGNEAYMLTGYELMGDATRFKQAPYIFTHLKKKPNDSFQSNSCLLHTRWDFAESNINGKFTTQVQIYRNVGIKEGSSVVLTKHKFRGKGRSLQLYFKSEDDKDFNILGWTIFFTMNEQE